MLNKAMNLKKPDADYIFTPGGFSTLTKALDYAAKSASGTEFFDADGSLIVACSFALLRDKALQLAQHLKQYNLPRGSYVGMLAETRLEFHIVFFACQYLGLTPCPLPFTLLPSGRDAYVQRLNQLLRVVEVSLLVAPQSVEDLAKSVGSVDPSCVVTYEKLIEEASTFPAQTDGLTPYNEDELAYVQFSSGSTSEPTGLLITQYAVMSNLTTTTSAEVLGVNQPDRAFTWLPLDHDMGLVGGVLSPVNTQTPAAYMSPASFSRNPAMWLELLSRCGSSISFAPVFAYALAAEKRDPDKKLDLSAWRMAGIGGDMVHANTLRSFAESMADTGFRFGAFCPAYGLAEATMTVSATSPADAPFIKSFLQTGHAQELVSCGKLMPGFSVRIKNESQSISTAQTVGEIWVKGPSVITQSLNKNSKIDVDEEGYISSGDLGFMFEEQLFITGRAKDLIIIRGRNIWAQDVEWAIHQSLLAIPELGVVALGIDGGHVEALYILIQDYLGSSQQRKQAEQSALKTVNQTFGVIAKLVWVEQGCFSLTSAGKLSRSEIKKNYLKGSLPVIKND